MKPQNISSRYDYIIAGAGASGLSLVWQILQSPLSEKKILVVDSQLKPVHDKTWCFWNESRPPFRNIIFKKWNIAEVSTYGQRSQKALYSHSYYCIRSIDFHKKILAAIEDHENTDMLQCSIQKLTGSQEHAILHAGDRRISAEYIFQSCFKPAEVQRSNIQYPLLQHFLGWEIETPKPVFNKKCFTLMDFDETFDQGIAFMYLLPWTEKTALAEYTVFSRTLLPQKEYENKIALYLNNRFKLKAIDYTIRRKEVGQIPMQDRPYVPFYDRHILNIGMQGGMTKPSTGYTFSRIQQQSKAIVSQLQSNNALRNSTMESKLRFKAYDLWLLHIIDKHPKKALSIFYKLFENNSMDQVFRFLNEQTSLSEDFKIMSSVPYRPFLNALWETKKRLFKL